MKELLTLPNILSMSRVFMVPIILYYLRKGDGFGIIISLGIFILAGISDGLDGYFARRQNSITPLGIALDPIADKLFAAFLIIGLIIYNEFPIWLAAAIVGRDLLILVGGALLLRGKKITLPSNMAGKYAFFSISMLMASYIVRFDFGITLTTISTLLLLALSMIGYVRVFLMIKNGKSITRFRDTSVSKFIRLTVLALLSIIYIYRLFTDKVAELL